MNRNIKLSQFIYSITFVLMSLFCMSTHAFIPSAKYIIERTALNLTGAPVYFENDVVITTSTGTVNLRELWLAESDSDFKVIIQGAKELKDKVQFSINYNGKSRQSSLDGRKFETLSNEFFQPLFFQKNKSELISFLIGHGVLPTKFNASKNFSKLNPKYFSYSPESFLKLTRSGGKVTYFMFNGQFEMNPPGVWIEQDFFNLLKIRTETGSTLTFEELVNYGKDIHLPKITSIMWGNNQTQLIITEAKVAKPQHHAIFKNPIEFQKEEYINSNMKSAIEDFYSKFR